MRPSSSSSPRSSPPRPTRPPLSCAQESDTTSLSLSCSRARRPASRTTVPPFSRSSSISAAGAPSRACPSRRAYVNAEGSWAYTIACPIAREGVPIATLYAEYTFDAIDQSLPVGFL